MGMIVALGVGIAAIWMLAIYGTVQEAHEEKYDVSVRPGAVSYGTHSSATIPMVSSPMHSTSAPMISGSAVRSYAHYGHASMPSSAVGSGFKMHTTSSATVHTVGSGGGASGGGAMTSGGQGTSSRGITYGGASVSMPILALATPMYSSSASSMPVSTGVPGRRKVIVDDADGEPGERRGDTDGTTWWYWNEDEGWVAESEGDGIPLGTLWNDGGVMKEWTGSGWQPVGGDVQDPTNTPLGDAPWHWILLLALAYGIAKMVQRKQNAIQ